MVGDSEELEDFGSAIIEEAKKQHYRNRGYGEYLQSFIEMAHFLCSVNMSNIYDPFEIPLPMLISHYKYQQKIIKAKILMETTKDIAVENLKSGTDEGKKSFNEFKFELTRDDKL